MNRKTNRSKRYDKPSALRLVTIITLCLLFCAALFYLQNQPHETLPPNHALNKPHVHFEFYHVLKNAKEQTQDSAKIASEPPTSPPHTNTPYIVQVAAVKNFNDADEIKAELALLGFELQIQKATIRGQTWYRLFIGPVETQQHAIRLHKKLARHHIKSLVRKAKF